MLRFWSIREEINSMPRTRNNRFDRSYFKSILGIFEIIIMV